MKQEEKTYIDDIEYQIGAQLGNEMSRNIQQGTDAATDGMSRLLSKAGRMHKVGYEQGKGNLFEYIEDAKLQRNLANNGYSSGRSFLTDAPVSQGGYGEHTAPDDFRITAGGRIKGMAQAKVNNNPGDTARKIIAPKYDKMQFVMPKENIREVKTELNKMLKNGEISKNTYNRVLKGISEKGLTDPTTGISSGGTALKELSEFKGQDGKINVDAVRRYANKFEMQQMGAEVITTAGNMAASAAIITGVISTTKNLFDVFQNKKELNEAIKDIGVDVVKSGARGGATGVLSSFLRIGGSKASVPVISDSSATTVIAAGIIDSGAAIYSYSKGEISAEQLRSELAGTVIKSTATIYFTKAIAATFGGPPAFAAMAIYSVASYIVTTTRTIIKNAELNAIEYRRIAELNREATRMMKEYHAQLIQQMNSYQEKQRRIMTGFLNEFDSGINNCDNYDGAIYAIVNFANQTGLMLQHADFKDFSDAMLSDDSFILR